MGPDEVNRALGVLGLVGALGLFLPSIETAWDASPAQADRSAARVRRGEQAFLATAVVLGGIASYGQRSVAPLVLCAGLALVVVAVYEHALGSAPAAS